jgi:hypothetical protein
VISVELDPSSLKAFKDDLKQLKDVIDSRELNLYRAKKYVKFTQDMVRSGTLNIKARSSLTEYITGNYDPLSVTGKLLEKMGAIYGTKKSGEAGYFGGGPLVPTRGEKKLTYTDLAILHHTGYRIPLQGKDGARVRAWYWHNFKIHFHPKKQWLIVSPRPFMYRSLDSYERKGLDSKAATEYMEKRLKGVFV